MRQRLLALMLLLLCGGPMLLLSGCWNDRELTDLAIVTGMGVDWLPETEQYRVSFQIVNPSTVPTGQSGGGGKKDLPIVVYTETGKSLFSALRKASQKVSQQLFFPHLQLLVIGEPLAKHGIGQLFDIFDRSREFRLNAQVILSRGSNAESVLRVMTPLLKVTALGLSKRIDLAASLWAHSVNADFKDVITALSKDGDMAISGIRVRKDPQIDVLEIGGVAMVKEGKLTGWLDGNDAVGVVLVQNKLKSTIVELACPEGEEPNSVEVVRARTAVKAELHGDTPVFHIRIREEGNVNEVRCQAALDRKQGMIALQRQWAEETERIVMGTVRAAQNGKSDILGFGDTVKRANPAKWQTMEKNWNELFAASKVDVKVEAYLRHAGMRSKPYSKSG